MLEAERARAVACARAGDAGLPGAPTSAVAALLETRNSIVESPPGSTDELLATHVLVPHRSATEKLAAQHTAIIIHRPVENELVKPVDDEKLKQVWHYFAGLIVYEPDAIALIAAAMQLARESKPAAVQSMRLEEISRWCATLEKRQDMTSSLRVQLSRVRDALARGTTATISNNSYSSAFNRDTYSTMGRYFTNKDVLLQLVDRLKRFVVPSDTYIDFSAGTNEFGGLLAKATGVKKWLGMDLYPVRYNACPAHFRVKNWFDVKRLPPDTVIGLNPPFGSLNRAASLFVEHALRFRPRMLALVLPDSTKVVAKMIAESNQWKQRARDAKARGDVPFSTADWEALAPHKFAAERAKMLSLPGSLPPYLVVDASAELVTGNCFYAPGTRGKFGMRMGGGIPENRGSSSSSDMMSGDLPLALRGPSSSSMGRAGSSGGGGASIPEFGGLSVRPEGESSPSWFIFLRNDFVACPAQVQEVTWFSAGGRIYAGNVNARQR